MFFRVGCASLRAAHTFPEMKRTYRENELMFVIILNNWHPAAGIILAHTGKRRRYGLVIWH